MKRILLSTCLVVTHLTAFGQGLIEGSFSKLAHGLLGLSLRLHGRTPRLLGDIAPDAQFTHGHLNESLSRFIAVREIE